MVQTRRWIVNARREGAQSRQKISKSVRTRAAVALPVFTRGGPVVDRVGPGWAKPYDIAHLPAAAVSQGVVDLFGMSVGGRGGGRVGFELLAACARPPRPPFSFLHTSTSLIPP